MPAADGSRLKAPAPPLGLLVVALVLFPEALRGFTPASPDILLMFLGQNETLVHCLARGAWPVWDPFLGFGQPYLANPGNQVLYPPTWLNLLFSPETCLTLYVLGHLLWAGLGTYALARCELGLSRWSAWLAAAAWMASGPLLSHVQRWQHFASIAWLPWVLLAARSGGRRLGGPRPILLGVTLALQWLAGSVEIAAATLLVAVPWTVADSWNRHRHVRMLLAAWLPAGLVAVALTTAQWLPAIEFLRGSARGEAVSLQQMWWSIHPLRWVELVAPLRPDEMVLTDELRARLFGDTKSTITPSLYLGATLGGLVGFALQASERRRAVLGLVLLGAAAAVVSMGPHGGVVPWLTAHLPFLGFVRFPGKMTLLVSFAWALLAGIGFDAWRGRGSGSGPSLARWVLAAALPAAAFACAVLLVPTLLADRIVPAPPPGARVLDAVSVAVVMCGWAVLAAAIAAALAWTHAARQRGRSAIVGALALVAVADLALPNHRVNPMVPAPLVGMAPETAQMLRSLGAERIHVIEQERPEGPGGSDRWELDPRTPLPPAEATFLGMNLALSGRSGSRWGLSGSYTIDSLVVPTPPQMRLSTLFSQTYRRPEMVRLLQAGAVSHVVGRSRELEGLRPVADVLGPFLAPIRVFAVPDPLPHAYLVGGAVTGPDSDALRFLLDPRVDLRQQVFLHSTPAVEVPRGFSGRSRIVRSRPDDVTIEVEGSHPGHAVLLDGYESGWRATVDGQAATVLRANLAFRAVTVPAGRHLVRMRYRPPSVAIGLAVSATALVLLIASAAATLVRRAR